jgi:regulator-associated protein of mTOR
VVLKDELMVAFNAWDGDAGTLHNDAWPLQLAFHSYDPVIAVTDDTDNIW